MNDKQMKLLFYADKLKKDFINLVQKFHEDTGVPVDQIWLIGGNKDCVLNLNEEGIDGLAEEDIQSEEVGPEESPEDSNNRPGSIV